MALHLRRLLAIAATVGAVLLPSAVASADTPSADVTVTSTATAPFAVSTRFVRPGQVRFHFISQVPSSERGGGSDVALLGVRGARVSDVVSHIRAQNQPPTTKGLAAAASSTRWLVAHTTIYGGGAIAGVGSADLTSFLPAGTLYLIDIQSVFSGGTAVVRPFFVSGPATKRLLPAIAATIDVTSSDRFRVTSTRLPIGRYLIRNPSDTIHFVSFSPVKGGTTNDVISRVADAEMKGMAPPVDPYLHQKTAVQAGVLTPGQQQIFSSPLLTRGTYDLECFIADDSTGVPHFFMGMHKIIVIS